MRMELEEVLGWIDDVLEQFQREEDQGILQQRLDKASAALAGKDACQRIRRDIQMRYGMRQTRASVPATKRRE
jgi:hypothetical protein